MREFTRAAVEASTGDRRRSGGHRVIGASQGSTTTDGAGRPVARPNKQALVERRREVVYFQRAFIDMAGRFSDKSSISPTTSLHYILCAARRRCTFL